MIVKMKNTKWLFRWEIDDMGKHGKWRRLKIVMFGYGYMWVKRLDGKV